jgi:hypothetical protein
MESATVGRTHTNCRKCGVALASEVNWSLGNVRKRYYICKPCDHRKRRPPPTTTTVHVKPTLPAIDRDPQRARSYDELRSKHGYVYVMVNQAWPQYVKIGSAGDLNKRLAQFNTGTPWRDYEMRAYVYADDRLKAEARVHEMLHEFRAGGEWFNTDLREAVECLEEVEDFDPRGFNE